MSKPEQLEWTMNYWTIEYGVGRFDVGDIGPDPANWRVNIHWHIKGNQEVAPKTDTGKFKTLQEVADFIYQETGLSYVGLAQSTTTKQEGGEDD